MKKEQERRVVEYLISCLTSVRVSVTKLFLATIDEAIREHNKYVKDITDTGDEYDEKGDVCVGILLDEYAKFLKNNFVGDEVFMMGMTDMREIHYSMAVTMDKLGYTLRDFVLLDHGVHFDKDTQTLCFDYYPLVVKLIEKHYKQIVDACKKYVERVEFCGY